MKLITRIKSVLMNYSRDYVSLDELTRKVMKVGDERAHRYLFDVSIAANELVDKGIAKRQLVNDPRGEPYAPFAFYSLNNGRSN